MWVFFGLLPTLIVLLLIAGGVTLLVRRGSEGWSLEFASVLLGYVAIAMLVGVFLIAAGAGLLLKAGFAEAVDRDFSYNVDPYPVYEPFPEDEYGRPLADEFGRSLEDEEPEVIRTVDPSDNAIFDDIATGISLLVAGAVLFGIHAFGAVLLRSREPQGEVLIMRAYSLVGLAVATLGFMGTGAQALNDILRRYIVGGDTVEPWQIRHPGEPLAIAVILLPLVVWFGWRVWVQIGVTRQPATSSPSNGL